MQLMHSHADRGPDCYATRPEAVAALLEVERLPHRIWEPAAGGGAIVRVLRDAGHGVIASDITDYGFPLHFQRDFLLETKAPAGVEAIVTNPPFRFAQPFVEHALELVPVATFLLRLAFLESTRRSPILDTGMLARVHVFRNRLPDMHRGDWVGLRAPASSSSPTSSSSRPFAWFVFDRDHRGPTTIDRISWSKETQ
jgi:hypothetical protein